MARKAKKSPVFGILLTVFAIILGLAGGLILPLYVAQNYFTKNITTDTLTVHEDAYYSKSNNSAVEHGDINVDEVDLSIHFIELGNKYTGDCTLIKVGNVEVLIDCGSKSSSIQAVSAYINQYCTDGILEYVIVTHAHQDHYAGFATGENMNSIFDLYECGTIIDFAQTNQKATSTLYKNYQRELADEVAKGATHYTAAECYNKTGNAKRTYTLGTGVELEILYNFYYFAGNTSSTENNYSVCCIINAGTHKFLFTGDLEAEGEEKLAQKYKEDHGVTSVDVDLYKAGHHGSKTSSSEAFLSVFQPDICCVCCCAGSPEYTKTTANQFPTQQFINNISKYTTEVYVTSLCIDYDKNEFTSFNGNIIVAKKDDDIIVSCSNNNTVLKDSEWFKQNRTCPTDWASTT